MPAHATSGLSRLPPALIPADPRAAPVSPGAIDDSDWERRARNRTPSARWIGWRLRGLVLAALLAVSAVSTVAWYWPADKRMPRLVSLLASAVFVNLATMHAALKAANGDENAAWEPTRREPTVRAETSRA